MDFGDYLGGLAFFVPTIAAVSVAAGVIARRQLRGLHGAALVVAFMLLATSGLVLVHLVPGALGVLHRVTVLACAAALLAAVWWLMPGCDRTVPGAPPAPSASHGSWVMGGLALTVFVGWALATASDLAAVAPTQVDVLTFHLPNVARWIQSGSLWQIHEFAADHAFGYYPNNGDLASLAVMLPWENDFLARLTGYPFLAMSVVGVYAIARELGAAQPVAALLASAVLAIPASALVVTEGLSDPFMLATFVAGILFLLRHSRTGTTADLALAGLGLGLSAGTKWYALPAVAIVLAVWLVGSLAARRPLATMARDAGVLGALVIAGCITWLARNTVEAGNPFFPAKVEIGGLTLLDAPLDLDRATYGNSIAEYLSNWDALRDHLLPALLRSFGVTPLVLLAGVVAAVVALASLRSGSSRGERRYEVLALVTCAALIGIVYLFLPYTAQGLPGRPDMAGAAARYLLPALVLAAGAYAWVVCRVGRFGLLLELAALAGLVSSLSRLGWPSTRGIAFAGACLAAGALVYATLKSLGKRWNAGLSRRALAGAAVGVVLLSIPVGHQLQDRFNDSRYRDLHPVVDYVAERSRGPTRVALAGIGFGPVVYPMFGDRFDNEVEYVGPFVDGMLRPHRDRAAFGQALERGAHDFVVVQLGELKTSLGVSRSHDRWVRDLGYRLVVRNPTANLYAR